MGQRFSRSGRGAAQGTENPLAEPGQVAPIDGADTLQMVIIVHRHGARFPTRSIPNDLNWPIDKQFWDSYGGELTPAGSEQQVRLGRFLGQRYVQGSRLFDAVGPQEMRQAVLVYTSNVQRTIFSAWSFLQGMFPSIPKHIAYLSDREELDMDDIESRLQQSGLSTGIAINVESSVHGNAKKDELFHQMDVDPVATRFHAENTLKHPLIRALESDPACIVLVDKLYKITQLKKLAPGRPMAQRIVACKALQTQINISAVHSMSPLPNPLDLQLSDAEFKMLRDIADAVWEGWYKPADSDLVEDGVGPESCGFLGAEIARCLADKRDAYEGMHKVKLMEFSCHDTNVLALAGLLGVTVDAPFFAGHWLFELHKSTTDEWTVRVIYNANPTEMNVADFIELSPRQLPLDGTFRAYSDLPVGEMSANALIDYLDKSSGFGKTARELRTAVSAMRTRDGKELLRSTVADIVADTSVKVLSEGRSRELEAVFKFLDSDHSGYVSAKELHAVLRRFGMKHVTEDEVTEVVSIFDMSNASDESTNDKKIDVDEFKDILSALDKMTEDAQI